MADDTCVVEGCDKPRHQHQRMCGSHYMRKYRYGDPLADRRPKRGVCKIDGCGKPHSSLGWCKEHYDRYLRYGDPLGEWVPRTDITYAGAHDRVEAKYGSPSDYECGHCGGVAAEWAYDHQDPAELWEVLEVQGGRWRYSCPYSVDPDRYFPLCVKCHRRFDRER